MMGKESAAAKKTEKPAESAVATFSHDPTQDPQSGVSLVSLPGGWIDDNGRVINDVLLQEMSGEEEEIFASRSMTPTTKVDAVLSNCIKRIGEIDSPSTIRRIVPELTAGDRWVLVIMLRRISVGDAYKHSIICPECKRENRNKIVDLSDLDVHEMEDPEKREFNETLPSGLKVVWSVMTGRDERLLEKIEAKLDDDLTLTLTILMRLREVDGQEVLLEGKKAKQWLSYVKRMKFRDREHMRGRFRAVEPSIERDVEYTCKFCSANFKTVLDVAQAGFFFPSAT